MISFQEFDELSLSDQLNWIQEKVLRTYKRYIQKLELNNKPLPYTKIKFNGAVYRIDQIVWEIEHETVVGKRYIELTRKAYILEYEEIVAEKHVPALDEIESKPAPTTKELKLLKKQLAQRLAERKKLVK